MGAAEKAEGLSERATEEMLQEAREAAFQARHVRRKKQRNALLRKARLLTAVRADTPPCAPQAPPIRPPCAPLVPPLRPPCAPLAPRLSKRVDAEAGS